ncbi:MAG TPA: 7-cyano-7-deazaguanine synthase QueC [Phycisphaerae bacterium]|nr:7-cyano-7-deazaguanine synthase QueC [Phycisphaerae bacterium]
MASSQTQPAVVLLSGGLDSATTLAFARSRGFVCHALSFDYGQRHKFELAAARRVATALGAIEHRIVRIDLSAGGGFGHSALTDEISVPKDRPLEDQPSQEGNPKSEIRNPKIKIPVTYVPARNTIFLSIALGYAEVLGAFDIFLGVNAVDYSGYPDCRPEFVEAFERLANLATAAAVEGKGRFAVHAPLIGMTKGQIIRAGLEMGVDYSLTHSCYDPSSDGRACGHCDACRLRRAGFAEAGAADPTRYVEA